MAREFYLYSYDPQFGRSEHMSYCLPEGQTIEGRIEEIRDEKIALELKDDYLFSNANGNLPHYNELCDEERFWKAILITTGG